MTHHDPAVLALAREILDALIQAIDAGDAAAAEAIISRFADRPRVAEAMQLVRAVLVEQRHAWDALARRPDRGGADA